jgi:hypothetical protein
MTKEQGETKPEKRSLRSAAWIALAPPALVFAIGLGLGIAWDKEDVLGRALRALLYSAGGPFSFLFQAGVLVRSLVVVGLVAVYLGLVRITPLGRAPWPKLLLGSAIWCALGFVAFVFGS